VTTTSTETQEAEPNLTIGDLARRTGLTPAVLRMWESRHGFPRPHRLESGHRRYAESDVALVEKVLRRRDAGIRLDVAISEAAASHAPGSPSVFAELRRKHPHLAPHRLKKSTLLALSWALEDEFCARAERPVLFGAFQTERFYRPSASRWNELARVARTAMVMADFPGIADEGSHTRPTRVPLADDAPMRREWAVVCDAVDLPACLTAWELPGQAEVPDRHRLFESIWTIEPRAVRDAARVCAQVALTSGAAEAGPLLYELADDPAPGAIDLVGATTLFNRVVAYVDRLSG
jgi:DICT domain-containing protein/predicted DNA-binding transcriptional regulator AlpA